MGKKIPLIPKTNAKVGQFQQSPVIPLSETPQINKCTQSKHPLSSFLNFFHKGSKTNRASKNFPNAISTKEAAKLCQDMPTDHKLRFKDTSMLKKNTQNTNKNKQKTSAPNSAIPLVCRTRCMCLRYKKKLQEA